jgi:hypothetical protein
MTARKPVVVGVIDDGIAFAHHRVRDGLQTRVANWWLQDGEFHGNVPYGRELTKYEIENLIARCSTGGALEEDEFYIRAGLNNFRLEGHKTAAWRVAHGTHVMDLACGYDEQPPYDQHIIAVQLPARVTADTSGSQLVPWALDAIAYIVDRADKLAHPRHWPIVINFSYGYFAGPHDGLSDLENAIDRIIVARPAGAPLSITLPAGNSFLSCTHAQASFDAANPSVTLSWRVLPDSQEAASLEIWMPYRHPPGGRSRVEVTITPPGGPTSPALGETPGFLLSWQPAGRVLCEISYAVRAPTNRGHFLVVIQPTADVDGVAPLAPAGNWTVTIRNLRLAPGEIVHAWIQRDETLYGHPRRGRQSRFEDLNYERYDNDTGQVIEVDNARSHVKREGTINAIATGKRTIVAGGFLGDRERPARYSSSGPTIPALGAPKAYRDGPDALTIGEDSFAHAGVLGAGSRSSSTVAMGGTSVACARLARWCAKRFAKGKLADRHAVKIRASLDELTYPPPRPTPQRGGAGRMRLPRTRPLSR